MVHDSMARHLQLVLKITSIVLHRQQKQWMQVKLCAKNKGQKKFVICEYQKALSLMNSLTNNASTSVK